MNRRILIAAVLVLWTSSSRAADPNLAGEFSATARVDTRQGTRSMAFNVVVSSPMTAREAAPLKKVLEDGGQQALLNAIRGAGRGSIKLGALTYPLDLVVASPVDGGYEYVVVTGRSVKIEQSAEEQAAVADYPFGVFIIHVPEMGTGDGQIYTQAALLVDAEGRVHAQPREGASGTLDDVRRVR
jgi:hypothetical protein